MHRLDLSMWGRCEKTGSLHVGVVCRHWIFRFGGGVQGLKLFMGGRCAETGASHLGGGVQRLDLYMFREGGGVQTMDLYMGGAVRRQL